jgi:hypothetical protein
LKVTAKTTDMHMDQRRSATMGKLLWRTLLKKKSFEEEEKMLLKIYFFKKKILALSR